MVRLMSRPPRTPPNASLLQAQAARLIRPLVRLMIGSGVTFPAFMDLVRKAYVDVALHDFPIEGKEQTDSRITLLTGVHRKEVRRLRQETPEAASAIPPDLSLASQIVARWVGASDYTDEFGKPLDLPRSGPAPSFEALVASVTKDVRSRAVLDDFLDRGLAVPQADETLRLIQSAVLPKPGEDHQLFYFGRNLHDHIAASAANVGGGERLFLERSVHYDRLTPEAARRLEEASRKLAMHALESANKEAQNVCEHSGEGEWRWNFGLYVYLEPQGRAGPATTSETGVKD